MLLIVLAAGSGLLLRGLDKKALEDATEDGETPNFFMEKFSTIVMGDDGQPVRTLSANRLDHYPDTKTKHLEVPHLVLHYPDQPAWHVRSERGWIYESGLVVLLGAVHAWRDTELGDRAIDIHTRDMRILPDKKFGETDQPVTITTRAQTSNGMGMRAYLAESRLELMARVKTQVTGHLNR
ncbi:MAG: LPS export ABC transporter periplasmic protein LptC [Chromatiales bacterium]|jgi:lipopolysaccharide export system protein LptC|nr:LPS export ABC transporter periplasmic protein LptC [Chromatiales bacterium]